MKINWKLRLQNKVTLISLITLVISFVFQILSLFDVVPVVSENEIVSVVLILVDILAGLGVIVDPTTKGASDSERALTYDKPN